MFIIIIPNDAEYIHEVFIYVMNYKVTEVDFTPSMFVK